MKLRARTTLSAGVNTPAAARAFVRETVDDVAVPVEDLTLVVSELVTNAVVAGSEAVLLEVLVDESHVLVEVAEESPASEVAPVTPLVEHDQERGMLLVSRLAARWGIREDGFRRVLWADLAAS